jgi:hypothetical protein
VYKKAKGLDGKPIKSELRLLGMADDPRGAQVRKRLDQDLGISRWGTATRKGGSS